ncbi:MAG: sporulation transcriptional regulator SpoIIID [Oscillospiraceae bacterium]|nr:sporulation transcriptional regulator SpoIIID [Oscillospiraceae bacterium]
MKEDLEKRACQLAVYMIETGATVRSAARHFGISKSTVHKTLTQRLRQCNYPLYLQVRQVLDKNKSERHIRGGMATKRKYKKTPGE